MGLWWEPLNSVESEPRGERRNTVKTCNRFGGVNNLMESNIVLFSLLGMTQVRA